MHYISNFVRSPDGPFKFLTAEYIFLSFHDRYVLTAAHCLCQKKRTERAEENWCNEKHVEEVDDTTFHF